MYQELKDNLIAMTESKFFLLTAVSNIEKSENIFIPVPKKFGFVKPMCNRSIDDLFSNWFVTTTYGNTISCELVSHNVVCVRVADYMVATVTKEDLDSDQPMVRIIILDGEEESEFLHPLYHEKEPMVTEFPDLDDFDDDMGSLMAM